MEEKLVYILKSILGYMIFVHINLSVGVVEIRDALCSKFTLIKNNKTNLLILFF